MKNKENRMMLEMRAVEGEEMVIEGHACVFNETALIGSKDWGFYERIDPNAFNGADLKDVPLKYNHNDAVPILARTRNGSLSLSVDDKGLFMRAKLLNTQDARDMYERVKAGLIDKMSFAFTVKEQKFDYSTEPLTRTIMKFDKIWDVSVVDIPAYEGTDVGARSLETLDNEVKIALEKAHSQKRDYGIAGLLCRYSKHKN